MHPLTKVSAGSSSSSLWAEQILTFSSKNQSWNVLLKQLLSMFPDPYRPIPDPKAVCIMFIADAKKYEEGWHSKLEIANSRILAEFLGAKTSLSLSKHVIYVQNKKVGCLNNWIFKIIATEIETGRVPWWPVIFQKIYVERLMWSLKCCPNMVVVQEQKHPSKFTQQKQFCFSFG